MSKILHKFGRTDGAEIAEVALVLPLVFMFLLGIVWFGRAFNIYATITQAAEQGATLAARPTCATCSPSNLFPTDTEVNNAVYAVMKASNLDQNQIIANPPSGPALPCPDPAPAPACSTTNPITICRAVSVNNPPGPDSAPQCGTTVSFKYPFQFFLPFTSLNLQQITLTAHAQSRMEN